MCRETKSARVTLPSTLTLTLDPEGDGVAGGGAERVGGGACVAPSLLPLHTLQRQGVARQDHAARDVLNQHAALQETRRKYYRMEG